MSVLEKLLNIFRVQDNFCGRLCYRTCVFSIEKFRVHLLTILLSNGNKWIHSINTCQTLSTVKYGNLSSKSIHENIILTGTHSKYSNIDRCVCLCCHSAAHHLFERAHGGYPNLSLSRCTTFIYNYTIHERFSCIINGHNITHMIIRTSTLFRKIFSQHFFLLVYMSLTVVVHHDSISLPSCHK